jgi:hypothetical protein
MTLSCWRPRSLSCQNAFLISATAMAAIALGPSVEGSIDGRGPTSS